MTKKIPKNRISKENLDIFGVDLIRHNEMKARFEKETSEKLEPFIQNAKKAQEFVERIKEASKPRTYLMAAPPRPLTRQDLEEALVAKKQKRPSKDPIVLVFERKTHTLFRKDRSEARYSVARAPLREKILLIIRPEFKKTEDLARDLNSTEKSIRSTVDKINQKAMNNLSLKEKVVLGEGVAGYRLNPLYSLVKK